MEESSREQIVKDQYLNLLRQGNEELSLLMTRCLYPVPEEGLVEVDLRRLDQELLFYEYMQNKGEWSALALVIPLCLAQSNPQGFLKIGERMSPFLKIEETPLQWGTFLLGQLIFTGEIAKEHILGCDWAMRTPQENIRFQRLRIQTLSSPLEFWRQIPLLFGDKSSYGKRLLEMFLLKADSSKNPEEPSDPDVEGFETLRDQGEKRAQGNDEIKKQEHAPDPHDAMADYLWKVRNFKIKRGPFTGSLNMEGLFSAEEGSKGFLSVLGEYVVLERKEEGELVLLALQTRRGKVRIMI